LASFDLIAAEKSLVELTTSGINLLPEERVELIRAINEMVFWAKLQNRHVLLAKLIAHAKIFNLPIIDLDNSTHGNNDTNPLCHILNVAVALTEGTLNHSSSLDSFSEALSDHNYLLPQTATACEIVINSGRNNVYLATTSLAKVKNNALFKQATLLQMLNSINLLKLGSFSEAIIHLKKVTLSDTQKDNLLRLMLEYHSNENIHAFDLKFLHGNQLSPRATEAYLLLNNETMSSQLNNFFVTGNKNDTLLNEHLSMLFEGKKYTRFVEAFENYPISKTHIHNESNLTKYLVAIFLTRGITELKTKISRLYLKESYINAFDAQFLNRSEVNLDILYQMIEQSIDKQVYTYTCSEVYKYSLHFYKKNRPGLARKIATISVMKKHEDYYSDKKNWHEDSDYRTLIDAVKELNNVVQELNRIGT